MPLWVQAQICTASLEEPTFDHGKASFSSLRSVHIHILSRSALREVFLRESPVGVLRVWAPWGCFSLFLPTLLDDAPFCNLDQKENRQNETTKLCPCINFFTSSDV